MSDVIIALIPSPEHAYLTAEGPFGERPALLARLTVGSWVGPWKPFPGASPDSAPPGDTARALALGLGTAPVEARAAFNAGAGVTLDVALVLYAPGEPRLGMVRAMEAADLSGLGAAYGDSLAIRRDGENAWKGLRDNERGDLTQWDVPEPPALLGIATDRTDWSQPAAAYALAHRAVQRGVGAEVLVLP